MVGHSSNLHYQMLSIQNQDLDEKTETLKKQDAAASILACGYCRKILKSTMYNPKSVLQISYENKIPISTTYRRVQLLHDCDLVTISGFISADGKKHFLYKSQVKEISVKFDGEMKVKVELQP